MIHAFNFSCNRDFDLSVLMISTFLKYCPDGAISTTNTDTTDPYKSYGNGAGWPAALMKVKAMSDILKTKNVADDDFILSVDSDVVFCSPEVFKYVKSEYGIIGTKHRPNYQTHFKQWSHMSGALIFLRGDIAKKICALGEVTLTNIRFQHFKPYNLTENEDVVLSYLAKYVGAEYFDLGEVPGLSSGNFESDIANSFTWAEEINSGRIDYFRKPDNELRSFYHLNYCPDYFLGEPTYRGKWNIPAVLKKKGIEL